MEKKKQQIPNQEKEQKTPLGFTVHPEQEIRIPARLFMDMIKASSDLNNIVYHIKTHAFNTEQMKYYFEEDIVEQEGNKLLRPDFWEQKEKEG